MTSARRRPLQLVPDPEKPTPTTGCAADDDWRAETVLHQWEPEYQLIGALMWMPADTARPILELVPDSAIRRPTNRWAYEIIKALVDQGRDPDPVVVLATGRDRDQP